MNSGGRRTSYARAHVRFGRSAHVEGLQVADFERQIARGSDVDRAVLPAADPPHFPLTRGRDRVPAARLRGRNPRIPVSAGGRVHDPVGDLIGRAETAAADVRSVAHVPHDAGYLRRRSDRHPA
jgi:hypothetical protein